MLYRLVVSLSALLILTSCSQGSTIELQQTPKNSNKSTTDLTNEYLASNIRIFKIIDIPETQGPAYLTFGTERTGINDNACGGLYVPPTCFLFIESDGKVRLVTTLTKIGSINVNTAIKFIDKDHITFTTREGDAGEGTEREWEINLQDGKSKLLRTKDISLSPL